MYDGFVRKIKKKKGFEMNKKEKFEKIREEFEKLGIREFEKVEISEVWEDEVFEMIDEKLVDEMYDGFSEDGGLVSLVLTKTGRVVVVSEL